MSRTIRPLPAALLALALAVTPALTGALGAISLAAASADDITWSVEPAPTPEGQRRMFEYSVDPGTQVVDSVVITNHGQTSADFVIYATDAINEYDTGAFGLLASDEEPVDAGAWIETADEAITLAPGTEATVPFTMLVPSDASPGDHVAGIVAAVLTKGEQDGAAVTLEQRVGSRVYLTVSGIPEAAVEVGGATTAFNASFNPFAPGDLDFSYTVTNTGNVRVDVNQSVTITGPFGIPLGEFTPEPLSDLLPRQTVRISAPVSGVGALLLAWSNVTATPGAIGTAGDVPADADSEDAEPEDPAAEESPAAEPTETPAAADAETTDAETTGAGTPDAESASVTDTAVTDAEAIEYVPATSSVMTLAVSWTALALAVLALGIIYLVVRYISGTRERMYLAIDEAAAAAREEALADKNVAGK